MKKFILAWMILSTGLKLASADVVYNYPEPDIINISNGINDYCINLTSGIDLVNCGNYWARNELGLLYTYNGNQNILWKENVNLTWHIFNESPDRVSLVGTNTWNSPAGNIRYGLNYTLEDEADRIQEQIGLRHNGNSSLNQVWLLFKIGDIKVSDDLENDFYADYEDPRHYDNLSQPINNTYNNLVEDRFQIEDIQNSEGIKLWWNDLGQPNRVNVFSDGSSNKEVTTAIRIGAINPGDEVRRDFFWVDIDVCSGNIAMPKIFFDGCVNETGGTSCQAEVGKSVNISYHVNWTLEFISPNGGCLIEWQDNTTNPLYSIIPASSSDPQEYCVSAGKYTTENLCISAYPYVKNFVYTHEIGCTGAGNWSNRGRANFAGNTAPFNVQCIEAPVVSLEIVPIERNPYPLIFVVSAFLIIIVKNGKKKSGANKSTSRI